MLCNTISEGHGILYVKFVNTIKRKVKDQTNMMKICVSHPNNIIKSYVRIQNILQLKFLFRKGKEDE